MRKITLTVAALATMTVASKAQIRFAPEVGVNMTNMNRKVGDEKIDSKFRPGFKVGGVVDIALMKKLSIQPGVFFSMKGSKLEQEIAGTNYEQKVSTNNIEIPVNVVYHFGEGIGDGLFVQAGPYLGYALSGKVKTKASNGSGSVETDQDLEIGTDDDDDLKPLDIGVGAGVGYQLPMGLFARVQGNVGLANLQPGGNSDNSIKNWGFGLSVGYFFGGK